jgi:hypothetical protein
MEMRHEEKLLEALLEKGLISLERAQEALMEGRSSGSPAAEMLVETGAVTEDVLIAFLARAVKTAPIDVTKFPVRRDLVAMLPPGMMVERRVLPMERIGSSLTVAVMNPFDESARKAVAEATGLRVRFVVTGPRMLKKRLQEVLPEALPQEQVKEVKAPAAEAEREAAPVTGAEEPLPQVPEIDRDLEAVAFFAEEEHTKAEPRKGAPKPVRARVVKKVKKPSPVPASAPPPAVREKASAGTEELPQEREEVLDEVLARYASPSAEPLPRYLEPLFSTAGRKRKKRKRK